MSIKGRPSAWFQASLRRRDLTSVRAFAAQLDHPLILDDALAVLELIAEAEPNTYDRAAARWLGRYLVETRAGLEPAAHALTALQALAAGDTEAVEELRRATARRRAEQVLACSPPPLRYGAAHSLPDPGSAGQVEVRLVIEI